MLNNLPLTQPSIPIHSSSNLFLSLLILPVLSDIRINRPTFTFSLSLSHCSFLSSSLYTPVLLHRLLNQIKLNLNPFTNTNPPQTYLILSFFRQIHSANLKFLFPLFLYTVVCFGTRCHITSSHYFTFYLAHFSIILLLIVQFVLFHFVFIYFYLFTAIVIFVAILG